MTTMRPLVLALALLAACTAPPPPLFAVTVGLDESLDGVHGWNADQRRALADYLDVQLDAWALDFRLVAPGAAEVVVRAADLSGTGACGRYTLGTRYVEVDAACAMGLDGTRRSAGHELGHYVLITRWGWRGHLCDWAINEPPPAGCHRTLRCPHDDCVMSRGLRAPEWDGPSTSEAYVPPIAEYLPAPSDVDLIRGCVRNNRCE